MIRFLALVSLLFGLPAQATVLDNGLLNILDASNPVADGFISVDDGPSGPTTARVVDGGVPPGDSVGEMVARGNSRIEIVTETGRFPANVSLLDSGQLLLAQSSILNVEAEENSILEMTGGDWGSAGVFFRHLFHPSFGGPRFCDRTTGRAL